MPRDDRTSQRSALNFRRLLRISVAAQIAMIVVVLIVGVVGGISMIRISEDVETRTGDTLYIRGVQNEFERSRLAVREFVNTGDELRLGPFTQARGQILLISSQIGPNLDSVLQVRVDAYVDNVTGYLEEFGEHAVQLKIDGHDAAARQLIGGQASLGRVKQINEQGLALQNELLRLQEEAGDALRTRQIVNIGLIVAAGLLILATSLGVMLWLRREMLQPLDELADASRRLGHGDLSARVKPSGVDEILLASSAFNQMADEVQQHVQQLHELSAARTRFVSSVSHELRTPITSLRGYLELLVGGEAGDLTPDQLRYVQVAERNARTLDELINDLLTLSRVQSGKVTLKPEPVDIRLLLRELKAEMLPMATEKKVDLVLVDTGDLVVSGEPLRLKQAFGNLIGNALKYSPEGQAVVVRAFRVNRQAVVSVVDWGPGVPKDELPQLAEPFFRASTTERIPGTGLGLPIAKQMIELHGGRLAVESEPGAGSTFTAYLPLRMPESADSDEPESPPATGESAEVTPAVTFASEPVSPAEPETGAPEAPAAAPPAEQAPGSGALRRERRAKSLSRRRNDS
ncbi:MAG: HAMP domain-containing protein [Actinobacteria bacterium]|nr:HAMP domain-containing protein [Actinomycetota bacterium]